MFQDVSLLCLPGLLLAVTVSQIFLVFDDLSSFEEYFLSQVFYRISFNLGLFLFFSRLDWVFGRNIIEVKQHSHGILSGTWTIECDLFLLMLTLIPSLSACQVLHHKTTLFFPLFIWLFRKKPYIHPTLKGKGLCSI